MLRERFVPVAIDQHVHRRRSDAEGRLFASVLFQAGRGLEGRSQGVFLVAPGGRLLAFQNATRAEPVKRLLRRALEEFAPAAAGGVEPAPAKGDDGPGGVEPAPAKGDDGPGGVEPAPAKGDDGPGDEPARVLPAPPAGGLVLDVTCRVFGGWDETEGARDEIHRESMGRDHLWVRRDERESLARGELPRSLALRIVRYHLVDNTRGEPPFWRQDEVRVSEWSLEDGEITARVELATEDGARGFQAAGRGRIEVTGDGEIERFDLVVRGEFRGEGRFTRGAPEGPFPFAVSFRIIEPSCVADETPPGGARGNLEGYLK